MSFDDLVSWLKSKVGSSQPAAAQPSAPKKAGWFETMLGLNKAAAQGDNTPASPTVTPASAGMSMEDIQAAAAAQAAAARAAKQ